MSATTLAPVAVVLMDRTNSGTLVELVWNGARNVSIRVTEPGEDALTASVPAEHALDAFHHPYAYLA